MLSSIILLLLCRSVLSLKSQRISSVETITSTIQLTTSVSARPPTTAASPASSQHVSMTNQTFAGNSLASWHGSSRPTAAGLPFISVPTASLIPFTSSASGGPGVYLSGAALLFLLEILQMA